MIASAPTSQVDLTPYTQEVVVIALRTALRHGREAMNAKDRFNFDVGRSGPEWMFMARDALRQVDRLAGSYPVAA